MINYINLPRKGNQEWTIQRHWENWFTKKQDVDKQSKNTAQKTKQD
jgi:hypothetical protein